MQKKELEWISLDPSIATVKDGVILGIESGSTEIVVKCGELTDKCKVTVVIHATALNLNISELSLTQGDSRTLLASIEPSGSTDQIIWESSDEGVAIVSNGVVTGIAKGEATITAIAGTQQSLCNVEVCVLEAVDLGLSVMWSNMNIGASSPEDYCDYYAWGEIEPYYYSLEPLIWKEEKSGGYVGASYKWANGSMFSLTKYCTKIDGWDGTGAPDNKTVLEPDDDVASKISGGKWRLPTLEEQKELLSKCNWVWTTINGVNGYKVSSTRNSNSIFIPAAGGISIKYYGETGIIGVYWSSTLEETLPREACGLVIKENDKGWGPGDRSGGRSIRPVTSK